MRKSKKQILGVAGLMAVGVMTGIAYCLPSPDVSANSDVVITANVPSQVFDVTINRPLADSETASYMLPINVSWTDAYAIDFTFTYYKYDGSVDQFFMTHYTDGSQNGIYTDTIDLIALGAGYGDFVLNAKAYNSNGTTIEDTTTFAYYGTTIEVVGEDEENGNPKIKITDDGQMDGGDIQVYDKDGNPIFIGEDGTEERIILDKDDLGPDGSINFDLPMEKYNAPEGEYIATVRVYDINGNVIAVRTIRFYYTPVIEVPNTGTILGNMNLSESDIITAGLVAFIAAVMVALIVMRKQNRRSNR